MSERRTYEDEEAFRGASFAMPTSTATTIMWPRSSRLYDRRQFIDYLLLRTILVRLSVRVTT